MINIKEITTIDFDNFASTHPLKNYFQSSSYGNTMKSFGYNPIYIGIYENNLLIGASLILSKKIKANIKYGYAPRGFLIDYLNRKKLNEITKELKSYFNKRGYAFIKINPEITYAVVNPKNNSKNFNDKAIYLIDDLINLGYKKLKDNIYFESTEPKFNPIVNLNNLDINILQESLKFKSADKGLTFYKSDEYDLNRFYELIKNKKDNNGKSIEYYKTLYREFKDNIDLFMLEIDYHEYLDIMQRKYANETEINESLNYKLTQKNTNKAILSEKMASDQKLSVMIQEMTDINFEIQNGLSKKLIATALLIKNDSRVNIVISGFDKGYSKLFPNYQLFCNIIKYYKERNFSFIDLNGISGDFSKNSPYKGLNEFKLTFNPTIYEYIGEFDLMVNQTLYSILWSTKTLQKEFDKQ